ncbi:uncharacterized protein LOC130811086 isoform X2 [Amaranthus tricolor]|uniref:uncharacterized protein LOC130811086 isoform X2 n=1 Tax=Amaranthus tricolor TaxID=29722 RepID=UPI00258AD7BF|nr:uncharacterized protein LOC130811086 isoform X2 [Amaranthus tricolor]
MFICSIFYSHYPFKKDSTANSTEDSTKLEQERQCQDLEGSMQLAEQPSNEANKTQLVTDDELINGKIGGLCSTKTTKSQDRRYYQGHISYLTAVVNH